MQIDWLTVGAQWINFLILMWLLQRFLYHPIINAMDKRQHTIDARLEEAAQKTRQAEQDAESYRNKLSELEAHRSVLMAAAREAADTERERLVTEARAEIETLSQQWRQEIEREKAEYKQQLRQDLGSLVAATARRALLDLTSLSLEQALLDNFLTRLQNLPAAEKRLLTESAQGQLTLASSAALDKQTRDRLTTDLGNILDADLSFNFEPLPESSCGLMLIAPAYTLEWRLERYFEELETGLANRLTLNPSHAD